MMVLDAGTVIEEVTSEITLDDLYGVLMEISETMSGIRNQVYALQDEVVVLQEIVSQKFDMLQAIFEKLPEYNQLQTVVAFLFMLVCFELMRLVRGWTNSFKLKGGN